MVNSHNQVNRILNNCWFCWENPQLDKSLIISIGNYVYLAIPKRGKLLPGHCFIIPMQHTLATVDVEEDIWNEIMTFRKCLVKMFRSMKKDCLFLETVLDLKKQHHTFVECIPIPISDAQQAPIYFKKAIIEDSTESEWTQHKKLIDTGKGLRKSVPQGFAYFAVDFANDGGYAHVIEDERAWKRDFGRSIVAGLLELDPDVWMRPHDETPEELQKYRKTFVSTWAPFDWTAELDGGEYN